MTHISMINLSHILSYILISLVFFGIDIVWLWLIAKGLYKKYLSDFLAPEVNWKAALIFYSLFIIGLMIFAIYPWVAKNSWIHAWVLWALFGFFTYATYDLTNLATLKNRPINIVFIDILWWMVLCGTVCIAWYFIVWFVWKYV